MTLVVGAYKEPSHGSSYKAVICIFAIELIYIYWKVQKNIKEFIQSAINAKLWKADSYATTNEVRLLQSKQLLHLMKALKFFL